MRKQKVRRRGKRTRERAALICQIAANDRRFLQYAAISESLGWSPEGPEVKLAHLAFTQGFTSLTEAYDVMPSNYRQIRDAAAVSWLEYDYPRWAKRGARR